MQYALRRTLLLALALLSIAAPPCNASNVVAPTTLAANSAWPEISWDALIPKGWDPAAEFKGLDFSRLQDADPRAMEALERIKSVWDNAPAEPTLNGRRGRIAGFVLPLEKKGDKVTEFLIVPYFGACIHTPPPPANQIIHAKSRKPLSNVKMMTPLWVYGTFSVQRASTDWGVAGYRLEVERIAPYDLPGKDKPGR